jgi:tellurite resistance protein TehA-like permease
MTSGLAFFFFFLFVTFVILHILIPAPHPSLQTALLPGGLGRAHSVYDLGEPHAGSVPGPDIRKEEDERWKLENRVDCMHANLFHEYLHLAYTSLFCIFSILFFFFSLFFLFTGHSLPVDDLVRLDCGLEHGEQRPRDCEGGSRPQVCSQGEASPCLHSPLEGD